MTLGRTALRLLPIPVQDTLRRLREATRLAPVPRTPCEPAPLGVLDRERLAGLLTTPGPAEAWPAVCAEIAGLGIPAAAEGVNPGDRRALYQLVRVLRPTKVLEVGTHIGASTAHIAAALRDNTASGAPTGSLTSVDIIAVNDPEKTPWLRHGAAHSPETVVRRLGMAGAVRFVAQPSLAFLLETRETYDFIFLDGDHSAPTVYRELPAALARLAPGGFLLLHDYFPEGKSLWRGDPVIPGVWLATERLRAEGAGIRVLPLGELPWPTKLGRSVTSLAAVTRAA